MALMRHLSDRYEVSITAAILKWLGCITDKRAMIVVGYKDGFHRLGLGSKRLFRDQGSIIVLRQETCAIAG